MSSNANPLVSVIVPAHNAARTLEACLKGCLQQTYAPIEVIAIDDGSKDDTARIAESFPVRFVHQEQRGPAAARNAGARIAQGAFLVYTDSDCVPQMDWVERLISGFGEGVAATGGTYGIANPDSLLARWIHEEILVRHAALGEEVDFLGSFNVAYEKNAFDRVAGFDEAFTAASGEDNDLAYRLIDAGGRLRFVHDAVVRHHHPSRLGAYLRSQMRHGFWRMKLYAKHPQRASGDRYAGIADLAAPVLICLVIAAFFATLATALHPAAILTFAALSALLIAARLQVPWRMMRRAGNPMMLIFLPVMLARDVARAVGMLCGIWVFLVLRKRTA
ncbi:MAG: hypothetical protein AMXMBFR82_41110 [Candidatus Hydrogenedentota bacterium]